MALSDAVERKPGDPPHRRPLTTGAGALTELGRLGGFLPGADGAAVVRIQGDRAVFAWADAAAQPEIEELQRALAAGPCRQAMDTGCTIEAPSAATIGSRWPGSEPAVRRSGVRSLLVVPLLGTDRCWGVLVLISRTGSPLPTETVTAATALAHLTAAHLALTAERDTAQAELVRIESRYLHDPLTGLPNRGLVHELTFHALAAAQRRGVPLAVLVVDLDGFTAINESRGQTAGDAVLREVAQRLRSAVRGGDHVGRLSGDEFLIVCTDLPTAAEELASVTSALADRVHAVIGEPITLAGDVLTVTAGIGVAITTDGPSVADLLHDADLALYEAKALDRGATIIHTDRAQIDGNGRPELDRQLFDALRRREFEVYYQPVHTRNSTLVAVEALIRWNHPTDGVIPAGAFIDTAAATGLIVPLGQWVIRQAVTELRNWRDAFPDTAPQTVWCNLGPLELVAPDLPDVIATALAENRLTPQDLGIEVLENHLDDPRLADCVTRLGAAGHPLALDDFGTGYSSLSRLVDLPVSHLKIDRSLVIDLPDCARSRTLVRAVLTIASGLQVTVISEGIETTAQADHLAEAGSHLFQGYLFGRPMPAARIAELLRSPATRGPVARPATASTAAGPLHAACEHGPDDPDVTPAGAALMMTGSGTAADCSLFEQLPTAYLILSPDLEIVDANAAYVALLGYPREDMIGRRLFEVFPPAPEALDEDGRNPVQLSMERARDTCRPDIMPLHQYDVTDPTTGAQVPRFWSLVHAPILGADGSARLLVQRVEDVSAWVHTGAPDSIHSTDSGLGAPVRVVEAELFTRMQELRTARDAEAAAIAALQESEARARAVLETAADGIITMTTAGIVQSMNPAAERMFGYPAADVVGRNVSMLMPEPDAGHHDGYLQRYLETKERRVIGIGRDSFGRRADGTTFPVELAVSEVSVGNPFFTGVLRDISHRKEMERQLAHQSTHDPLTGLANRTLLVNRLEHAVARLARHPGFLAVFFIDLDRFKPVNDTWGHGAGDELLTCVADRLRHAVRTEDLVARWGGDEFVVLCEELDQMWKADIVADRISRAVAEPATLTAATLLPSASVGFVVDDGTHTADQILAMADNAMYRSKSRRPGIPRQADREPEPRPVTSR